MIWVSIQKRKPKESGYYYWKGKSSYGGKAFYDHNEDSFDFHHDIPVNKVSDDYLFWLDEENAEYEEND
jgi:hypothetical protein